MALFGDVSGGRTRREPRSAVEFRAGKMSLSGTTVTPDIRKGLVFMKLEDDLMHFCWKDRTNGQLEDDFIIFPGDAKMLRIPQCTTGRVFLLKFKDNDRKYFYWLQEPKDDKDSEYLKKVNEFIDNPNLASLPDPATLGDIGRRGLPLGGQVTHQQLMELLSMSGGANPMDVLTGRSVRGGPVAQHSSTTTSSGGGGGGGTNTRSTASTTQRPLVQLGDLQSALESLQVPTGSNTTGGEQEQGQGIGLNSVLTSEVLRPLVRDSDVHNELLQYLPQTNETTETVVTSPQFQQALSVFSNALASGQLGPLVTEFGLSSEVSTAASTGNIERFASALEDELKEKQEDKEDN